MNADWWDFHVAPDAFVESGFTCDGCGTVVAGRNLGIVDVTTRVKCHCGTVFEIVSERTSHE